jgi:hypothetical protein
MRYLLSISCFLAACTAQAQFVSLGVKGGVPVTPAIPGLSSTNPYLDTGRWTVGPTLELHLVSGLSFETDALFRGYTVVNTYVLAPTDSSWSQSTVKSSVKAWDFPLLLKYRLPVGAVRPFLDGGYSFTHESTDAFGSFASILSTSLPSGTALTTVNGTFNGEFQSSRNLRGPAAGVGVEFRHGRIKIAPEVRYTHLNPNTNLATVLVGVTF